MMPSQRYILAVAFAVAFASASVAQDLRFGAPQVYNPGDGGQYFVRSTGEEVISLEGLDPIGRPRAGTAGTPQLRGLLDGDMPFRGNDGGVLGGVGGSAVGNRTNVNVGFTYITPLWTFRGFQQGAPANVQSFFPAFGSFGSLDGNFAYAPKIDLNYAVSDLDLVVSTSGTFLNLSGRVDRLGVAPNGTTGQAISNANLTVISAIPVEFGRSFVFGEFFTGSDVAPDGGPVPNLNLRIGSRYVALDQQYNVQLNSGNNANSVNRNSIQSYRALGITAASILTIPLPYHERLKPFLSLRQSLVVGENRRTSIANIIIDQNPALTSNTNIYDNRTLLSPITEAEFGFDWTLLLNDPRRDRPDGPKLFTLRFAAVGQYWYGLGPLSAGSNQQQFRRNDLFLVGAYLQAGVKY